MLHHGQTAINIMPTGSHSRRYLAMGVTFLFSFLFKIEGIMAQTQYLSILQDGVVKTIEWDRFNPSHVIFQHDNDPKHIA
jgi:hypothetical protein